MRFSVIIPIHFNIGLKYIINSIDSIINQTIIPFEIIIVFDGKISSQVTDYITNLSTDIIKINIIIIRNKVNVGPGISRNIGVQASTSDYIAFMDADDFSFPDRFELQLKYLYENKFDIIGGQIDEFDESLNNFINSRQVPLTNIDIINTMKYRNAVNNVTVMMRKECFMELGGYPNLYFGEDYVLWLKAIDKGYKIINLNKTLVKVRTDCDFVEKRLGFKNFKNNLLLYPHLVNSKSIGIFFATYRLMKISFLLLLPLSIKKKLFYYFNR